MAMASALALLLAPSRGTLSAPWHPGLAPPPPPGHPLRPSRHPPAQGREPPAAPCRLLLQQFRSGRRNRWRRRYRSEGLQFFLAWYLMSLDMNPIATKAVTSTVLTLAVDLTCQKFQVLAANFVALAWNVILTFKAHKEVTAK
ncbi:uncharacterized protein LOC112902547 [Panicum hallii]|uniref:uncharacterized protein LOC112902547 n=1 Tax=Panicum hallii TaxID=206008 RepID=UPI000DF4DAE5|nr:uncharacterized protein LOC112902547 [Panicum hallii]